MPVALERPFQEVIQEMSANKQSVMQRQRELLEARHDLSNRPWTG